MRNQIFTQYITMTFQSLSKRVQALLCASLCIFALSCSAHAVTFTWATVGDTGNPTDPGNGSDPNIYGAVANTYRIATHEVTNTQYAEFLNAVADADSGADPLYNTNMGSSSFGGINRSGSSGSYTYSVKASFDNRPVVYTSWNDSARFANWLHNGQPTGAQDAGTTESGAYDMSVSFPMRLLGATHFLPSEDEWYKAAYYAPGSAAGGGDDYWQYPTQSDTAPTEEAPPGGTNSANYDRQSGGVLTDVGAYSTATSHYGAFDMGGNVWEWNEAVIGTSRGLRGGSWLNSSFLLQSSFRNSSFPSNVNLNRGFRVASIPEPATGSLVLIALVTLGCRRRRR